MAFITYNFNSTYGSKLRQSVIQLRQSVASWASFKGVIDEMSSSDIEMQFGVPPAQHANFISAVTSLANELADPDIEDALNELGV